MAGSKDKVNSRTDTFWHSWGKTTIPAPTERDDLFILNNMGLCFEKQKLKKLMVSTNNYYFKKIMLGVDFHREGGWNPHCSSSTFSAADLYREKMHLRVAIPALDKTKRKVGSNKDTGIVQWAQYWPPFSTYVNQNTGLWLQILIINQTSW